MQDGTKEKMQKKAIILGAGITGLKTAAELAKAGYAVTVLEKNAAIGGMAYSFRYKDCTLDYGPHKFYSQIKGIMPEYKGLLGQDCLVREKTNSLYLLGKYFHFPPSPIQLLLGIDPRILIRCSISYNAALLKSIFQKKENKSYEDYFINGFGNAGYELLFKDFCWKVWGNPKEISEELARRRIPIPNISEFIRNALTGARERPDVSAKYFYYPKQGFGQLADILFDQIRKYDGSVFLETCPVKIEIKKNKKLAVWYANKKGEQKTQEDVDILISTIHLKDFLTLFEQHVPEEIHKSAENLKYRGLRLCYVVLNKERALKQNWYFYPEKNLCFNRVSEQKSFSPHTVSKEKTIITAEVTCDVENAFYKAEDQDIQEKVIEDLEKVGVLKKEEVLDFFTKKMRRVYPLYRIGFREDLKRILSWIHCFENIYTIGRQGLFNYNNTDHCMDMANQLAKHIIKNGSQEEWETVVKIFDSYKIVD